MEANNQAVRVLVEFIRRQADLPMAQWPEERLAEWIAFHAQQGSVYLSCRNGAVTGLGIGYQVRASDLEAPYPVATASGECFYVAQLIAETPEDGVELWRQWAHKVRGWKQLKVYGRRHGKVRRITMREIDRVLRGWLRSKEN